MRRPSPLGGPGCFGILASPKASSRIAAIPKGSSPPAQTLTPGLQAPLWAKRRKKRDDAFPFGSLWASPCPRRASRAAWGPSGPPPPQRRARKTRVSCGPHTISSPRPVTRPQASSAFRANPIKFAPSRLERPKFCQTPPPLTASRGEGKARQSKYILAHRTNSITFEKKTKSECCCTYFKCPQNE